MPTSSMKKAATHSAGNSLQDAANARLEFPVRRESSTKWWTKKGTRDLTEAYLKFLYTSEAWAKGTSDAADDGPIRPVPWCRYTQKNAAPGFRIHAQNRDPSVLIQLSTIQ